ncbi:MAG: glycoside hydrolase family 3 N-terminal domain-containing protein [Ruthenibacterium sp.]
MVDLRKSPYYLSDEDIMWVHCTIEKMTLDEKIGQLFVQMGESGASEERIQSLEENYHQGGLRYQGDTREPVADLIANYQKYAKLPLLVASNCDNGGDGAYKGGTFVCSAAGAAASKSRDTAYQMGVVAAREAGNVGCNWLFNPCVDILMNWRNTIVNTRCFGDTADGVIENARAFIRGVHEGGLAVCCKHFPGDGEEELDQHLVLGTNNLSAEDWRASYGKVYEAMIEEDIEGIMVGHFAQRALSREFVPGIRDEEIMPATLSPELLQGLLRKELGFNGLVVTDASHMVGMTGAMARRDILPAAIAAGCDLFLFFNDPDEDFGYMMDGYKNGVITEERLQEALQHILGTKAHLGLHKKAKTDIMPPKDGLSVIGCKAHVDIAKQVSDLGITLVKNVGKSPLPISPEKYKRILIVTAGQKPNPMLTAMLGGGTKSAEELLRDTLTREGYEVEIFVSAAEKMAAAAAKGGDAMKNIMGMYAGKSSIEEFKAKYDLVIQVANVSFFGAPVQRLVFGMSKGGFEMPWYVHEVPVIFVSMNCPYHLADVPQVKTYINCYDAMDYTIDALVDKLSGRSAFKGVSPVDAFCGMVDAHI